jgi:hypothetical protein
VTGVNIVADGGPHATTWVWHPCCPDDMGVASMSLAGTAGTVTLAS